MSTDEPKKLAFNEQGESFAVTAKPGEEFTLRGTIVKIVKVIRGRAIIQFSEQIKADK